MNTTFVQVPGDFARLDVPVPPQLPRAMGYRGQGRYIATYWDATGATTDAAAGAGEAGGEAVLCDGRSWFVATSSDAYQAWARHPLVAPALIGRGQGRWQVIDRLEGRVYAAAADAALAFLRAQWPRPAARADFTPDEWARAEKAAAATGRLPTVEEVRALMADERGAVAECLMWIDLQARGCVGYAGAAVEGRGRVPA